MTTKEIQKIELEIMNQLHLFCEKHHLRYCMVYGTLLGAVRHKGFIPWDNDMDIMMPRPDYVRFLKLLKTKSVGKNLEYLHYTNDLHYHYQIIRIYDIRTKVAPPYIREQPDKMGVWVDIFPADGYWEKPWQHPVQQSMLFFYRWIQLGDIYALKDGKGIKNKLKCIIHTIFPGKNNIHEYKIDYYASLCKFEEHTWVGDSIERKPSRLLRSDFEELIKMPFECYNFYAPKHWKKYLKECYGDYMQLPPESQRQVHDLNAEWVEQT